MRVVCIEDEPLILEHLSSKLQQMEGVEISGTYLHPAEAAAHIFHSEVDAVFLDINLPEIKGIDLARQIMEEKPNVLIVFLTAHKEYAVEAFELNAADYLVKPIQINRLQSTVERLRQKLSTKEQTINLNEEKPLYIKVSNHLAFSTDGEHFLPLQWRTSKAEELFLLLLHNRGNLVDKYTIKEIIWKDFDVSDSLLHTTVSYIRKALKDYKQHLTVVLRGNAYYLEMKQVEVDLFQWEKSLDSLSNIAPNQLEKYEQVMKQYPDMYLKQYSYIWLEPEKERLEQLWTEAMKEMASLYVIENHLDKAFSTYQLICERQPDNEEAHFLLMKLYAKNGYVKSAFKQYKQLSDYLQEYIDTQPNVSIQQWYNNLLFVEQHD